MFLIGIWLLHFRFWATYKIEQALFPLFAVVIVLASWSAAPVLLAGLLLSLLVALELAIHLRASRVSGAGAIAATR
jgi:hypothetical protein